MRNVLVMRRGGDEPRRAVIMKGPLLRPSSASLNVWFGLVWSGRCDGFGSCNRLWLGSTAELDEKERCVSVVPYCCADPGFIKSRLRACGPPPPLV